MKQLATVLRNMLLIGASVSLIALIGCSRNANQSGGSTGDSTGAYNNNNNANTGTGTTGNTYGSGNSSSGAGDINNGDNTTRGNTGNQPADRDQTGSTARRGGADNTGLGTGTGMSSGENATSSGDQSLLEKRIRQDLQKDNSFGSEVDNIKITAKNGTVTLRGPVTSQRMKDDIESKVKDMAGVKNVDNQLQVTNSGQ